MWIESSYVNLANLANISATIPEMFLFFTNNTVNKYLIMLFKIS